MIIIELIYNLTGLVALSALSGFIDTRFKRTEINGKIIQGLLFGITAVLGMIYPFVLTEGIIFDGRSIVISLCTLFFGPVSGIIAALFALTFRIYIGGSGVLMGSLVILSSFLIGLLFYFRRNKSFNTDISKAQLYLFGFIVHAVMLLFVLVLPAKNIMETYATITATVIGAFPLVTLLIGKILLDQEEKQNFVKKLKESEKLFRTSLYSIGDAVITTDVKCRIRHMNASAEHLTGWKESEAKGNSLETIFNIINEETREKTENPVSRVLIEGRVVGLANHTLLISKDGKEIPIADSASPIFNDTGEIEGIILVFSDKTAEHLAEKALLQSEAKLKRAELVSKTGNWQLSLESKIITTSEGASKIYGLNGTQWTIPEIQEFILPEYHKKLDETLNNIISLRKSCDLEFKIKKADTGEIVDIYFVGEFDEKERIVFGIIQDITEEKKAEEKVRQSFSQFQSVWENSLDAMRLTDEDGNVIMVNEAYCRMFEKERKELEGKSFSLIYKDKIRTHIAKQHNDKFKSRTVESLFDREMILWNGKSIWIESTNSFLVFENRQTLLLTIFRDISASKYAEIALQSTQQKLKDILENSTILFYSHNIDHLITYVSPQASSFFGVSSEEALVNWTEFITKNPVNLKGLELTNLAIETGKPQPPYELELIKKNGEIIWVEVHEAPVVKDGKTISIVGSLTNITERKFAAEALKKSEGEYRNLFESANDAIMIFEPGSENILEVNTKACEVYGFTKNEFIGMSLKTITEDVAKGEEKVQRTINEGSFKNFRTRQFTKEGKVLDILVNASRIEYEGKTAILSINRDITEHNKAEKAIRRERALLRTLIDNLPDAIYVKDLEGRKTLANKADLVNTGCTYEEELIGKTDYDFFPKEYADKFFADDQKVLQTGEPVINCEESFVDSNGNLRWLLTSKIPLLSEQGKIKGLLGIGHDITNRKISEAALSESEEKYRRMVDFSPDAVIVHSGGKIQFANLAALKLIGAESFEQIQNKPAIDFVHPDYRNLALNRIKKIYETGEAPEFAEEKFINLKNETIDVEVIGIPINYLGNMAIQTVVRDISARKKAEEALQEMNEIFRLFMKHNPVYVFIKDENIRSVYLSDNYEKMLGRPLSELIGKTMFDLFPSELAKSMIEDDKKILQEGKQYEFIEELDGRIYSTIKFPIIINGVSKYLAGYTTDITEKKEIEMELVENERRYRTLFDLSPTGILLEDIEGNIIDFNEAYRKSIGYSREELIGKNIRSIVPPEDLSDVDKHIELVKTGKTLIHEVINVRKDGEKRYIELRETMITLPDGKMGIIVVTNDITEYKLGEEERNRLTDIIETTTDLVGVADKSGNAIYINRAGRGMLGIPGEADISGTHIKEFHPEWAADLILNEGIPAAVNEGTWQGESSILKSDGREIPVSQIIISHKTPEGDVSYFSTVARDITERKQVEKALRESELKFRSVWEKSTEGMRITDAEGIVVMSNNSYAGMVGKPLYEIEGKPFWSIYSEEGQEELIATYKEKFKSHSLLTNLGGEVEYWNGKKAYIELTNTYLEIPNHPTLILSVFRDITEKRNMINELIIAKEKAEEINRLKSLFLANMSHELRTPLIGILGYSEMMLNEKLNLELQEMAGIINSSGKRLLETLNLILDLSRVEANKLEIKYTIVDVDETIKMVINTFGSFAASSKISLRSEIISAGVKLFLDKKLFENILNNLVNNAIKFTNTGSVTVKVEIEQDCRMLGISVIDTGIGISEENQKVIFDEFRQVSEGYSRKFEGTGLGLTITRKFIQLMNGTISVTSRLGIGSTFKISFPLPETPVLLPENGHAKLIAAPANTSSVNNILVVDDDDNSRNIIPLMLKKVAHVDAAENGLSALKMMGSFKYDLVFLDISLRGGMDGIQVLKELRKLENYKKTPIVAFTAFAMVGDKEKFLSHGFDLYLSKPFTKQQLFEIIKSCLDLERL